MSRHVADFWSETERYHDLAVEFDRNVERVHPPAVTSDGLCKWCYHCIWAASSVIYYEYRGPSV